MRIDDARELAQTLRRIQNVQVIGVKTVEGREKALVISINRRGRIKVTNLKDAVGKVAKLAGVKGHVFESINICSECFHELRARDGHYHSMKRYIGAEGVCCDCLHSRGYEGLGCSTYPPPPRPPETDRRSAKKKKSRRGR